VTFLTSRTAVLTHQDCPRRRYYSFLYNGTGITGSKQSLDTFIGSVTHRGLQNLLEHTRVEHDGDTRLLHRECINQSVKVANTYFYELLQDSQGFYQKADDYTDLTYKIEEAWALCEGFIRSFALWRLPIFGELYKVLEVENEEKYWFEEPRRCIVCAGTGLSGKFEGEIPLGCEECSGSGEIGGILFQAKADGLLLGRQDSKLYVLSFKTARDFTEHTMKQILHDMQGMSEIVAIEDRLETRQIQLKIEQHIPTGNNLLNEIDKYLLEIEHGVTCHAVNYEYLLKGKYQQDPWNSGIYKWQNPLIHCLKNDGILSMMSGQRSGLDYKWKANKGPRPKGWEKIDIWNDMGIEAWIDLLLSHEIQPEEGDPFQNIFRSEVVIRDRKHIEEWKIATKAQEVKIATNINSVRLAERERLSLSENLQPEVLLARLFPKHTNRCHDFYGNDCPFVAICHENFTVEELIEQGVFITRKPHHETERNSFKEKGYLK